MTTSPFIIVPTAADLIVLTRRANSARAEHRQVIRVACQRDGTTVLPRAWDHLEVLSSMADLVSGVNGDAPALAVGGAFDDEGVGA